MKHLQISLIIALAVLFAMCSPKVGQNVDAAEQKAGEQTEQTEQVGQDPSFRSSAPEPGPARPIEIGEYSEFVLDNGLKVIVVENHKLPRVSYQLFIDRDHVVEGDEAGLTAILGDLLKAGTEKKTKAEIDEAVDFVGGNLSTNSRGGFASSLTKHSDKILSLFAEVMLMPSFPDDEFEKLKKQTISGLQTQKDDPNAISSNVSHALLYGKDHPYGEITTETTVSNLTLQACQEFYNTYFKPEAAYMVVVGDINPEEAKQKVATYFGDWDRGTLPDHEYTMPMNPEMTQVDFVDKAGAVQSVINVAHVVNLHPANPDVMKTRVMNTILGSGFSGRLFKNLREEKAYTYGAYSSLSSDELVANFSAGASVRNEVTDSAITEILYELEKIRIEPVSEGELELAKNYIAGSFARSLESPQTVANFALNTRRFGLQENYYETYLEQLDAVTIADVQKMAIKYVHPDKAHIVVVGSKDDVAEKLVKFDKADGKISYYDVYANELKPVESTEALPEGKTVIENFIAALGGKDKLESVNSLELRFELSFMGQPMEVVTKQKEPNKIYMEMSGQGMTLMKQKYDGERGIVEQMGQKQELEGDALEDMESQAKIFEELDYLKGDYTLATTGMENVEDQECYKVIVTSPDGTKSTQYFSKETALKIKEITTQETQGQTVTATNTYHDYMMVDGIQFPKSMTVAGTTPMPMTMELQEVKVNPEIDDSVFAVE